MGIADPYYEGGYVYLSGPSFLLLAALASDRCKPNGFSLDAQTAQVMAAIAAEAFIDEFAFNLSILSVIGKADNLARIGAILQQLEASRVQVVDKFVIASQLLPGEPFVAGKQPLQSFRLLINLRNSLVHPKVGLKPPGWFSYFVHNELTVQAPDAEHVLPDWRAQLQSKQCASWACRATCRIVAALVERVRQPCLIGNVPGVYEGLESSWSSWMKTDSRIWHGDASDSI